MSQFSSASCSVSTFLRIVEMVSFAISLRLLAFLMIAVVFIVSVLCASSRSVSAFFSCSRSTCTSVTSSVTSSAAASSVFANLCASRTSFTTFSSSNSNAHRSFAISPCLPLVSFISSMLRMISFVSSMLRLVPNACSSLSTARRVFNRPPLISRAHSLCWRSVDSAAFFVISAISIFQFSSASFSVSTSLRIAEMVSFDFSVWILAFLMIAVMFIVSVLRAGSAAFPCC